MISEVWKPVPGYEGLYEVSDRGRVKSLARKTNNQFCKEDIILSPGWVHNKNGYLFVYLCKDGVRKHFLVHRLVALVFIPNPFNLPMVNHKDENPQNNSVENLEWCGVKYNINYGNRTYKAAFKKSIPVFQYTKNGVFVKEYRSAVEAERETGICSQNISKCRAGKLPSAGGFIWRYA